MREEIRSKKSDAKAYEGGIKPCDHHTSYLLLRTSYLNQQETVFYRY